MLVLAVMTAGLLAGCGGGGGGSTEPSGRLVSGPGFTFRGPSDWTSVTAPKATILKQDEITLVSVTVLPLVKAYRPKLFPRVVGELDRVSGTLASRLHGAVTGKRTVVVAGGRARQYDIAHGDLVDRLTFVLRGKQEFLLTCRWRKQDGVPAACAQLASTFSFR